MSAHNLIIKNSSILLRNKLCLCNTWFLLNLTVHQAEYTDQCFYLWNTANIMFDEQVPREISKTSIEELIQPTETHFSKTTCVMVTPFYDKQTLGSPSSSILFRHLQRTRHISDIAKCSSSIWSGRFRKKERRFFVTWRKRNDPPGVAGAVTLSLRLDLP